MISEIATEADTSRSVSPDSRSGSRPRYVLSAASQELADADNEAFARFKNGDESAFIEIMQRHREKILNI